MLKSTAQAEQFYERSGSESTKGSRKGFSLLGGGECPVVVLTDAQRDDAERHIENGTRNLFLWDANFPTEGAGLRANFRESLNSAIAASTSKGEG